jgi:hypothetical protein
MLRGLELLVTVPVDVTQDGGLFLWLLCSDAAKVRQFREGESANDQQADEVVA